MKRSVSCVLASAALALPFLLVAVTPAQAATTAITSAGPLTHIGISTDLNCSVNHAGDSLPEFYGTTACGTLAVVDGILYGPLNIPAGSSAAPRTTWTEVSQSAVTGTGTAVDPFKTVTVVAAGTSGVSLTETDSYVVGQESYRTDVSMSVSANRANAAAVRLYRGGDCYLQNSDFGFGSVDTATGAVACVNAVSDGAGGSIPGTRIEQWVPLTSGSHYFESFFDTVWAAMGSQSAFPDTCDCNLLQDNGAGLSWDFTVQPGGQRTQSHLTNFSPLGAEPLATTKTAQTATVGSGGADSYTITIHNPGATTVPLTSFTDQLPAGFTYTAGSTTGATTSDPTISAQSLTWPVTVSLGPDQSASLHFAVTVATAAGTYFNEASGTATADAVVATGPTAPVTVTAATHATATSYNGATTGTYSDPVVLGGHLVDSTISAPLAGKAVSFTVGTGGSAQAASAGPTNASGDASVTLAQLFQDAGSVPVTASFAGDGSYTASSGSSTILVSPDDCTLAYSGDALVPALTNTMLKAQLTDPDPTQGDLSGHTITFTVTDSAQPPGTTQYSAMTNASGVATASVALNADVYSVGAGFAGDLKYAACGTSADTLVTVTAAGNKVTGGGWATANGSGRFNFGFNLIPQTDGSYKGQFQTRSNTSKNTFHGRTVTSAAQLAANKETWSGTGTYNGQAGATFTVTVVDSGSGSKSSDTIALVVRNAAGTVVLATSGPVPLKGGNITIH